MATARDTIITGLEALRILGFGRNLPAAHADYCLKQLNAYLRQLTGFGGSMPMQEIRTHGGYAVRKTWPAQRIMVQGGGDVTLPTERMADGARIEVVDASNTASVRPITIAGGDWLIGDQTSLTIDEDGGSALIMFRADLGRWIPLADLELDDDLPFPADCDEAIALYAATRYHRFGQNLSDAALSQARDGERRLYARYVKPVRGLRDPAAASIGGDRCIGYSANDFVNGVDL